MPASLVQLAYNLKMMIDDLLFLRVHFEVYHWSIRSTCLVFSLSRSHNFQLLHQGSAATIQPTASRTSLGGRFSCVKCLEFIPFKVQLWSHTLPLCNLLYTVFDTEPFLLFCLQRLPSCQERGPTLQTCTVESGFSSATHSLSGLASVFGVQMEMLGIWSW